jgi:hypothetical protein
MTDDDDARAQTRRRTRTRSMIYETTSTLFRSFLKSSRHDDKFSHEGKRKSGPGEKASANKPVMDD